MTPLSFLQSDSASSGVYYSYISICFPFKLHNEPAITVGNGPKPTLTIVLFVNLGRSLLSRPCLHSNIRRGEGVSYVHIVTCSTEFRDDCLNLCKEDCVRTSAR
jgi:hypothetical protein